MGRIPVFFSYDIFFVFPWTPRQILSKPHPINSPDDKASKMDSGKNVVRGPTGPDSQFEPGNWSSRGRVLFERARDGIADKEKGHKPPIQNIEHPGLQHEMEGPKPVTEEIPTEEGGYQKYKAAGKLKGKKAVITGGDSGEDLAETIRFFC